MSIPVIICDDSSFARKQVQRALPSGWDVTITPAANGREAIAAIEAGKGDIILLDLTMPDMDGFAVLEYIRSNDLPTLPIVISGDIQPESRARVMALGAVAFIKKPVDAAELTSVLADYGVLSVLSAGSAVAEYDVRFDEWCQEIANVAMGRAADLLAKVIDAHVELSIPRVSLLERSELEMMLAAASRDRDCVCVSQGFIGGGIAGENLLLFHDAEFDKAAALMQYAGSADESGEIELYMDVADILVGAFLRALAEQLDIHFSQGHPHITLKNTTTPLSGHRVNGNERKVLTIEIAYRLGQEQIHCNQLVLITAGSIGSLQQCSGEAFAV